ncbi:MAG: helix-turn-helix transcriptional regulator [Planctomycetia bacterium]|nr:helix-turn-helix transcriptional regulator [Planctomycetia bacterium]
MKIEENHLPQTVLEELGLRLAQYRISANITQAALSERSGLSLRTVKNIESGKDFQVSSLIQFLRELGLASRMDLLVPDLIRSPVEQIKEKRKTRKRVSSPRKKKSPNTVWKWGDEK